MELKITPQQKALVASYLRSALAAVVAVVATGNSDPKDIITAAVAAVAPPALRFLNPKDAAFGRGSKK